MKARKLLPVLLSVTASAFVLSGCSDWNNDWTAEKLQYRDNFTKAFGEVDSEQDFNLATRASITVTPGTSNEIKIYSQSSGSWKLVGHYSDVKSTSELGVDVIEGTSYLLVTDGKTAHKINVGGAVDFTTGETRSGKYDTTSPITAYLNEGPKYAYYYFNKTEALSYRDVLSEINQAATAESRGHLQKDGVTKNFTYVSQGEFIVYPTYWATTSTNKVGVYYYDESNQIVKVPLMGNGGNNESLQYKNSEGLWTTPNTTSGNGVISDCGNPEYWRSKGVVVDIPVGTVFGFYLDVAGQGTQIHYSNASLNGKTQWTNEEAEEDVCYCSSYYDSKGDLVLGMEDWHDYPAAHSDFDLNDLIFKFGGNTPIVVDETTEAWILAYEDLGSSFDWDFNDVILKFEHVSGEHRAKITPLAAGGTLHSHIYFKESPTAEEQSLGEVHTLFGVDEIQNEDELYSPINASSRGKEGTAKYVDITANDFSLANLGNAMGNADVTNAIDACGVYLKVGTVNTDENSTVIAYQGAGKVPELLILPETYVNEELNDGKKYVWAWPKELVDIRTAYDGTKKFSNWVNDHTQDGFWFMYPTGSVVEQKFSMVGKDDNKLVAEYTMENYGEVIALPTPENKVYTFSTDLLPSSGEAIITIAGKGSIELKKCNDYAGMGSWSDINGNSKEISFITGLGTGIEGIYQVRLTAEDIQAIKEAGSTWTIKSGVELLAMAIESKAACPMTLSASSVTINTNSANSATVTVTRNSSAGEISILSTSNDQVATATVSGTTITINAVGNGTATISVKIGADDTYAGATKTINVTVTNKQASTFALSTTATMNFTTKGTQTYTWSSNSNGEVTAESDNPNVTVVVDGNNIKVSVNKSGTNNATITVRQAEYENYGSAEETFKVSSNIVAADYGEYVSLPESYIAGGAVIPATYFSGAELGVKIKVVSNSDWTSFCLYTNDVNDSHVISLVNFDNLYKDTYEYEVTDIDAINALKKNGATIDNRSSNFNKEKIVSLSITTK